jgi:hypothetical protein
MWIPFHHPSCTCGDCIISCIGNIEDNTPSSNDLRIYNDPASDEDGVKVGVDFGSTDETGTNSDNVTIRENYDILEGENFSDMFLTAVLRLMTGLVFFSDRVSPRMYDRLRLDVVNKHGFYLVIRNAISQSPLPRIFSEMMIYLFEGLSARLLAL